MTYKLVYFNIWSQVLDIILAGDHLNDEGLNRIIALRKFMKLGINKNLLSNYPVLPSVEEPVFAIRQNDTWMGGWFC